MFHFSTVCPNIGHIVMDQIAIILQKKRRVLFIMTRGVACKSIPQKKLFHKDQFQQYFMIKHNNLIAKFENQVIITRSLLKIFFSPNLISTSFQYRENPKIVLFPFPLGFLCSIYLFNVCPVTLWLTIL